MTPNQNRARSPQPRQQFLEWYHSSPAGTLLQMIEASYLLNAIQVTYNQKILQVGRLGSEPRFIGEDLRTNFHLIALDELPDAHSRLCIHAQAAAMPIASESVDIVLLPHVLEFEDNPRAVLQEVARILRPEGQLLVLGFNPWNLRVWSRQMPFYRSFRMCSPVGCHRLMDWLALLKFEAEFSAGLGLSSSQTVFRADTLLTRSLAHMATSYAVRAIKRTYTLIPIKPVWINTTGLIPGRVVDTPLMRKHL